MPRIRKLIVFWLPLLILTGCVTKPYVTDSPQVSAARQHWIGSFGAPELNDLVHEAISNNPDLETTLARVDAARATAGVVSGGRYPSFALGFGNQRTEKGRGDNRLITEQVGLTADASWEVDLWQRVGHRARAAGADAAAAEADYKAARLLLMANIAKSWFGLIAANAQVQLAGKRVVSFDKTLSAIQTRYRSGIGEALDVRLARENLSTAQATLALRRQQLDAAKRTLEALLGRYPNANIKTIRTLPDSLMPVPGELQSRLLLRRPDVRAAEYRLHAEVERNVDVQRNFLPSFRLTASGGRSSDEFRHLLNVENLIWSVAASITQPIFQGGQLQAERLLQDANRRAAVAQYSSTVLTTLREVETALAAEPLLAEQEKRLKTSVSEAKKATELAASRYAAGLTEIITLLDTQRRAFNTESALLDTRLQRLSNRIDLYLALGGDDEPEAEL